MSLFLFFLADFLSVIGTFLTFFRENIPSFAFFSGL